MYEQARLILTQRFRCTSFANQHHQRQHGNPYTRCTASCDTYRVCCTIGKPPLLVHLYICRIVCKDFTCTIIITIIHFRPLPIAIAAYCMHTCKPCGMCSLLCFSAYTAWQGSGPSTRCTLVRASLACLHHGSLCTCTPCT